MRRIAAGLGVLAVLALASGATGDIVTAMGAGPLYTDAYLRIEDLSAQGHAVVITPGGGPDGIEVEIDKEFTEYGPLAPTGAAILLKITVAPGTGDYTITITDEIIANNTGVDWFDYEMFLSMSEEVEAAVNVEGDIQVPGPLHPWTMMEELDMGVRLHGGVQPDGTSAQIFFSPQPLQITVDRSMLEGDEAVIFFKQRPSVPEPATMGLLSAGVLGLAALRRRRK